MPQNNIRFLSRTTTYGLLTQRPTKWNGGCTHPCALASIIAVFSMRPLLLHCYDGTSISESTAMSPVSSLLQCTAAWFWGQAYDNLFHLSAPYSSVLVSQHRRVVYVGQVPKPTDLLVSTSHLHCCIHVSHDCDLCKYS